MKQRSRTLLLPKFRLILQTIYSRGMNLTILSFTVLQQCSYFVVNVLAPRPISTLLIFSAFGWFGGWAPPFQNNIHFL